MPVSAGMLTALQSNVTFLIPVWVITASDGTVAAFAAHTRNITYNSIPYLAAPVEPTSFSQVIRLDANHVELFGVFDDIVTEQDVQGGRWKNAPIVYELIAYDPATGQASATATGYANKMKGQAGKFSINNQTFRVEFRSLSDLLSQEIGEITSPMDRNRRPEGLGVSMVPFTHARTVTAVVDRMNFTVGGTAQANDYFAYGRAEWTGGDNDGLQMEVKANVGNAIVLQLAMRSAIQIGDTVDLIAGYDGSREQARDKFGAMEQFNGEPDLPGLKAILKYED